MKKEAKTFANCGWVMGEYAAFGGGGLFALVRGALGGLVEGAHFFDAVADDVVYEFPD